MPSILNAQPNGLAPSGASVGDIVNTAGGMYQVMSPGTPGASYNDASGLWSKKLGDDYLTGLAAYQLGQNQANTARSEAFAQQQMDFQTEANAKAMAFSADEAEKNRRFQERLSNTAHQREIQDLIAAGLNPILSVNHGGATTPTGAAAAGVTSAGSMGNVDTSGTNVMNNLVSALTQKYVTDSTNFNQRYMNDNSLYTQRQIARLQTDTNLVTTAMNAKAITDSAGISAAAAMYASDNAKQASMYASDKGLEGTTYSSDTSATVQREQMQNQINLKEMQIIGDMLQSYYGSNILGVPIGALNYSIDGEKIGDLYKTFQKYIFNK